MAEEKAASSLSGLFSGMPSLSMPSMAQSGVSAGFGAVTSYFPGAASVASGSWKIPAALVAGLALAYLLKGAK